MEDGEPSTDERFYKRQDTLEAIFGGKIGRLLHEGGNQIRGLGLVLHTIRTPQLIPSPPLAVR
jgi:hypothetical protein